MRCLSIIVLFLYVFSAHKPCLKGEDEGLHGSSLHLLKKEAIALEKKMKVVNQKLASTISILNKKELISIVPKLMHKVHHLGFVQVPFYTSSSSISQNLNPLLQDLSTSELKELMKRLSLALTWSYSAPEITSLSLLMHELEKDSIISSSKNELIRSPRRLFFWVKTEPPKKKTRLRAVVDKLNIFGVPYTRVRRILIKTFKLFGLVATNKRLMEFCPLLMNFVSDLPRDQRDRFRVLQDNPHIEWYKGVKLVSDIVEQAIAYPDITPKDIDFSDDDDDDSLLSDEEKKKKEKILMARSIGQVLSIGVKTLQTFFFPKGALPESVIRRIQQKIIESHQLEDLKENYTDSSEEESSIRRKELIGKLSKIIAGVIITFILAWIKLKMWW